MALGLGYNANVMAKVHIFGKENITSQPSLYLPNRMNGETLLEMEKILGGSENVAYIVEEILLPDAGIMKKLANRRLLKFNFRNSNSKTLREKLLAVMQEGLDIVFVPGRPNSIMGCISDVPMPFMMQLAALHISPVPVYVGLYRNDLFCAFTSSAPYDYISINIQPKLAPGPLTGERVMESWLAASADAYDRNPLLDKSLARLLVEGMRRYNKSELIDGMDGSSLPYGKMLGVAMALARALKDTVKEERLGIILPPGKAGVIANYACILAGIVPVNVNYTSSESAFESIVRQSGIRHFITARAFMSKLPQFPWPKGEAILHIDKILKGIGMAKIASWVAFAKLAPMPVIARTFKLDARHGDDEAVLLFTSGSSGEPKGVALTHRMVLANITQLLSRVTVPAGSRFLCSLPIFHSFGLTVTTVLPPLYGFSMVTYPSPLEAKKLNELIEQYECKLVVSTPTFARSMLRRAHADSYKSVQYFVVGAEKLQKAVADEFARKCNMEILEGYGLTETSPVCAVNLDRVESTPEQPYYVPGCKFGTVGQLLPGVAVRLTDPDDDDKPLPLSEQGMIWLRGANVFRGYIGRDDLNATVFRDGWFKTGDLGTVDLNGFLTLGGRRSRFSKVGGEMVPHEVVENAIDAFVQVPEGFSGRAIAIVGVPDAQRGEALVMLSCVHQSNFPQALDEIRTHLVEQGIPRLWSPRDIIPVEAIPVLPTGKMDLRGCQILANEALGLNR